MPRVRLTAGALTLDLRPEVGGSIAAFRAGDEPLMRTAPDDYADVLESACFPLVPYSNRVRDGRFVFRGREVRLSPNLPPQKHPLHGMSWRAPWRVEAATSARAELVHDHAPGEWPWAYRAVQRFALDPDGLSCELECENTSDEAMPCGLGLHPYFPADAQTVLDLRTTGVWTIDAEIMPVRLEPSTGRYDLRDRRIEGADLDNGYEGWDGAAALRWPDRGLALRTTAPDVSRFQVYAPKEGGVICAEPVTHANGALNRPEADWAAHGLKVLEPGERLTLSVRFAVERL